MPTPGPRKVNRYTNEFKRTAVRLTEAQGVQVKDVAEALDIHPFMLSKWRKEAREGLLVDKPRPASAKKAKPKPKPKPKPAKRAPSAAEVSKLSRVKKELEQLRKEHELLKKFIRFRAEMKRRSLRSSRGSEDDSR